MLRYFRDRFNDFLWWLRWQMEKQDLRARHAAMLEDQR